MASVNKVIIIGNLGRDPEMRYLPNGDAVCNVSVGCTDSWKDKATGEKKELTEWVRVSFFGKLAEIAGKYLTKGRQVYVEGSMRTRKWTDKEGVERYTTEVRGDVMKMLGTNPGGESQGTPRPAAADGGAPGPNSTGAGDFEDDIPF